LVAALHPATALQHQKNPNMWHTKELKKALWKNVAKMEKQLEDFKDHHYIERFHITNQKGKCRKAPFNDSINFDVLLPIFLEAL
jgi:hypothetical protein